MPSLERRIDDLPKLTFVELVKETASYPIQWGADFFRDEKYNQHGWYYLGMGFVAGLVIPNEFWWVSVIFFALGAITHFFWRFVLYVSHNRFILFLDYPVSAFTTIASFVVWGFLIRLFIMMAFMALKS